MVLGDRAGDSWHSCCTCCGRISDRLDPCGAELHGSPQGPGPLSQARALAALIAADRLRGRRVSDLSHPDGAVGTGSRGRRTGCAGCGLRSTRVPLRPSCPPSPQPLPSSRRSRRTSRSPPSSPPRSRQHGGRRPRRGREVGAARYCRPRRPLARITRLPVEQIWGRLGAADIRGGRRLRTPEGEPLLEVECGNPSGQQAVDGPVGS